MHVGLGGNNERMDRVTAKLYQIILSSALCAIVDHLMVKKQLTKAAVLLQEHASEVSPFCEPLFLVGLVYPASLD